MNKNIILTFVFLFVVALSFADGIPTKNNSIKNISTTVSGDDFLLPDGYFNINYNLGWSVGEMNNFINTASYRGFSIDGRKFINDKVTIGGYMSWTGFEEKFERKTYNIDQNTTVTGVGTHTYYNFNMGMNVHYYPLQNGIIKPYLGVNLGPTYQNMMTQIGRYYIEDQSWQFMVAPELGVFIPFGPDSDVGVNTGLRYNLVSYKNTNYGFTHGVTYMQWFIGVTLEY
ncbi:MAG: hypothetical protein KAG84_01230 [Bacteroidales bacterium]|nr:hypothetical protein [Bacteroidales bacterium]